MDKQLVNLLKESFVYILFVIVVIFGGIYLLLPKINTYKENIQTKATKQETVDNLQREADALKESVDKKNKELAEENKREMQKRALEKPIFKTTVQSGDAFSANAQLFEDIIRLIKANRLKLISIENQTTGFEDPIAKGASQYNACLISMQLLGSYSHFQKFLTYLYDYPYLINIYSMDVIPYDKDKKTLIINLSVILYSESAQSLSNENEQPKDKEAK